MGDCIVQKNAENRLPPLPLAMEGACSGIERIAEAQVSVTARGERSSWEAAATKSVCLLWYSATGFRPLINDF